MVEKNRELKIMTKAELITILQELDAPDNTEVYIYGDFEGGQLDHSPINSVWIRNDKPHDVGMITPDGTLHTSIVGFSGILISSYD